MNTKYFKSGLVQIDDKLELKDFTWYVDWDHIVNMSFDKSNMILNIEVHLDMGGALNYDKMMPIRIPSTVSQSDIDNGLLLLPQFENSTIVP